LLEKYYQKMMNELCTFIIYFGKSFFQKVSPNKE